MSTQNAVVTSQVNHIRGRGTRSSRPTALLIAAVLALTAFLAFSASRASAEIVVEVDGAGSGTVTSNPAGIECSNTPGAEKQGAAECSEEFPFLGFLEELTATPDSGSRFAGWTGDDPDVFEVGVTCNSGSANPCTTLDLGEFGEPPIHITATFKKIPDRLPDAVTEGTEPGANDRLTRLRGTVNPEGFGVDDCYFDYGLTTKYGLRAPCSPAGSQLGEGNTPEPVHGEAELELLEPSSTYHYRLVASNSFGDDRAEDRTFETGPAPSDSCPNAGIRAGQVLGAILLADCMALEMASPPVKGGQAAFGPVVSAEGNRVRFISVAALGDTQGPNSPEGDPYIASRGSSEWSTSSTSPPAKIVKGWGQYVTALNYTPDFSRWFQLGSTWPQYQLGIGRVFQGGLNDAFTPFSPLLVPLTGGERRDSEFSEFQGSSPDRSHVYFIPGPPRSPRPAYLPGDPEPLGESADSNTYVAQLDADAQPTLQLLARDRAGKVWGGSCGARLGGIRRSDVEGTGRRNQGAISGDGSHVYFSARPDQPLTGACDASANKLRILERLETDQGPWVGELFSSECDRAAPACSLADGNDYYQGASREGSLVYFTSNRQLTDSDVDETNAECSNTAPSQDGCDLYLFDATLPLGQRLIQVSAGGAGDPAPGKGAKVLNGTTAIAGDGSRVYFVAEGVLTASENPEGDVAQEGEPNLYVWDRGSESTTFVGTLSASDGGVAGQLWGESGIYAVPELGDGHILPFVSAAPLTADDQDGNHRDLFRYDASTAELIRVSKADGGGADNGPFDVQVSDQNVVSLGTDSTEISRTVSEDGATLAFTTDEGLVEGDANGDASGYLWRGGKLYRLPGALAGSTGMSHSGNTVAFTTAMPLLPRDGDSSLDVYVVRAGGGYTELTPPEPCQPDPSRAGSPCRPEAPPPPAAPAVGSSNGAGPGSTQARPHCRKGQVRRHGRCVKRPAKKRSPGRHKGSAK